MNLDWEDFEWIYNAGWANVIYISIGNLNFNISGKPSPVGPPVHLPRAPGTSRIDSGSPRIAAWTHPRLGPTSWGLVIK